MAFSQFIPQYLGETAQTTILNTIKVLNATQKQLSTILNALTKGIQYNSILLQNIQIKVGSNQIQHTLGYNVTGWQIVDQTTNATFYRDGTTNANPKNYLVLIASAPSQISLLVF